MPPASADAAADAAVTGVDAVFRALADPTRRGVVERLGRGPATVGDLAAPFAMALPSFMQHLRVLEGAGLVQSSKTGRVRTVQLATARLRLAEDWLAGQRRRWSARLDRLDAHLLALSDAEAAADAVTAPARAPEADPRPPSAPAVEPAATPSSERPS